MIELSAGLMLSAFVAGVLMFLAPCTLPLVPAYVAFISGVKRSELDDPSKVQQARRRLLVNGTAFVLGFSLVFILFGIAAGALGSQIGQFRGVLSQVGGAFIIFFGLFMLGAVSNTWLTRERRFTVPTMITPGHPSSAFIIGTIFALGWTPCVGPVLATIIVLATDSATVTSGGLLLAIFSLGLAVPFLLTALLYAQAESFILRHTALSRWVQYIGGVFLIIIGLLLLTSNFELTLIYGYKVFQFLNFEAFYDYL